MEEAAGAGGHTERVVPARSRSIRPALPRDRAAILDVARRSGLFSPEDIAEVDAMLDGFLTGTSDADRWLVNVADGDVAAVAYYAPERLTDGTWNLYLLAVHPRHRGQGRGTELVHEVEQDLRRAAARVLLIETSGTPDFAPQRAFYARLGYHEEARIREFYAPGEDKVVYWKSLDHERGRDRSG